MKQEVIREDVEVLAKALCRAYSGAWVNSRDSNWKDVLNKTVEDTWREWIPKAKELADKTYGPLLEVCQFAYRKHVLEDDSIGWESLGDKLANALVGTMGDDGYNKWLDSVETVK
jgi:hypothetical protein